MGEVKTDKRISVFGMFQNRGQLERAVMDLKDAGFRNSDISALLPEPESTKAFAHEKHTKAPEGAAAGAGTGAVVGGTLGWLAGIGAIAIPGLGPFIAAGPILAALAGMGVGGAVGGLTGALVGLGIPEYEAKRYESFIAKGGYLLSVHADDRAWADRARGIIRACGATEVDTSKEEHSPRQRV